MPDLLTTEEVQRRKHELKVPVKIKYYGIVHAKIGRPPKYPRLEFKHPVTFNTVNIRTTWRAIADAINDESKPIKNW